MFFVGGNEHTFGLFFFTYLKLDKLNLSNSAANWGNILFWIANIVCIRNRLRNTNNYVKYIYEQGLDNGSLFSYLGRSITGSCFSYILFHNYSVEYSFV